HRLPRLALAVADILNTHALRVKSDHPTILTSLAWSILLTLAYCRRDCHCGKRAVGSKADQVCPQSTSQPRHTKPYAGPDSQRGTCGPLAIRNHRISWRTPSPSTV